MTRKEMEREAKRISKEFEKGFQKDKREKDLKRKGKAWMI